MGIKCTIGNFKFEIGDWGLEIGDWNIGWNRNRNGNRNRRWLEKAGKDWNKLECARILWNRLE